MYKINKYNLDNLLNVHEQFFTEYKGDYYHNVIMDY